MNHLINMEHISTRGLNEADACEVRHLDRLSGECVAEWLDTDMSYGIFYDHKLIGYLTLGYADECGEPIESHPVRTCDSLMLSNVFVCEEYRGQGLGKKMISQALVNTNESVFLSFLYDELIPYYNSLGFAEIGENAMLKIA